MISFLQERDKMHVIAIEYTFPQVSVNEHLLTTEENTLTSESYFAC